MIKKLIREFFSLLEVARKKIGSLNVALLLTLTLGLAVGVATYISIDIVSRTVIENMYMSEEEQKERADEYAADLQDHVTNGGYTSKNTKAFTSWMADNKYVYLMVYNGDELLFGPETEGAAEDKRYDEEKQLYLITMADGEKLGVALNDSSEMFYYELFNVIKLVAALVALFAVMLVYVQRLTARISRLADEVGIVSGGETERHINISGHDEITELSHSVEQMRVSILTKIESERAALEANSELITSMSHDIRTPLTVLLGYMDMMKERAIEDPTMMEYVLSSEKTAMRLKRLSDDLFSYFLLFGKGSGDLNMSRYNFGILANQMLAEFVFLLSEREYVVEVDVSPRAEQIEIETDPDMFMRIIENLLSNMFKYADKESPISIKVDADEEYGRLVFKNTVYRGENKAETNGIGLKSCRKIAETLGIGLEFGEDGDIYTTTISCKLV